MLHTLPAVLLITLPVLGNGNYLEGPEYQTQWNVEGNPGNALGRSFGGHFTDDLVPDILVVQDSRPYLLYGSDRYGAGVHLFGPCEDTGVIHNPILGRDVALVVGIGGLSACTYQGPGLPISVEVIEQGAWNTVKWLRSRTESSTQRSLVIGLDADEVTVSATLLQAGSPWQSTPITGLGLFSRALDLTLLDWTGDGSLEIAALTKDDISIYDQSGTRLFRLSQATTKGILEPFSEAGDPREKLAWMAKSGSSSEVLLILDGEVLTQSADLTGVGVVGLASGDVNLDGNDDLGLSIRAARELVILENQLDPADGSVPRFTNQAMSRIRVGDEGVQAPNNGAQPLFFDLDLDGDLDYFQPVEDESLFYTQRNQEVSEAQSLVVPTSGQFAFDEEALQGVLMLELAPPAFVHPQTTHLEIIVWHKDGGLADADKDSLERRYVPWSLLSPLSIDVTIPANQVDFIDAFPVELGLVELDGGGNVINRFSVAHNTFVMDSQTLAEVEGLDGWGPTLTILEIDTTPWTPDPVNAGGFVPRPRINPFRDSEVPD